MHVTWCGKVLRLHSMNDSIWSSAGMMRGQKLKYCEKNVSQHHSVTTITLDLPGINTVAAWLEASN